MWRQKLNGYHIISECRKLVEKDFKKLGMITGER